MAYQDVKESAKSQHPGLAKMLVEVRNIDNKNRYDTKQHLFAYGLLSKVETVYVCSRVFLNYGPKCMDIKVEAPNKSDTLSPAAIELEKWCADRGVKVTINSKSKAIRFYFNHKIG